MAHVAEAFDTETAKRVDRAVQACVEREQLSEGTYCEVHWCLFVNRLTPAEVIENYRHRLACFENSRPSRMRSHSVHLGGTVGGEWISGPRGTGDAKG